MEITLIIKDMQPVWMSITEPSGDVVSRHVVAPVQLTSLHSPVPCRGHRSQLRPQALPTVQQHTSWVRLPNNGSSQPRALVTTRKHWPYSGGDSGSGWKKEGGGMMWGSDWVRCRGGWGGGGDDIVHTHTAVPLQHQTSLAGALEAAQCVQAVSVLADALDGALVDVCKITKGEVGGGPGQFTQRK